MTGIQAAGPAVAHNLHRGEYMRAIILATIALAGCVSQPRQQASTTPPPEPTLPITLTESQKAAVTAGVKGQLKDPNSAMFGPMAASQGKSGLIYVCGYVNSRNSFGGYVGDTLFYGAMPSTVNTFLPQIFASDDINRTVTVQMCMRYGVPL